jgi:hypothetical protein
MTALELLNQRTALFPKITDAVKRYYRQGRPITRERMDRIMDAIERSCHRRFQKAMFEKASE